MEPTLSCTAVTAGYGPATVLHELSASFPARAISVVLGPNGSGKSTLLRVLAGTLRPTHGEVRLASRSYDELPPRERARYVALVPQLHPPTLPLTVEEALRIARYPQRDDRGGSDAAIEAALDCLGIRALRRRLCESLSGGELRRVLIAQGLVQVDQSGVGAEHRSAHSIPVGAEHGSARGSTCGRPLQVSEDGSTGGRPLQEQLSATLLLDEPVAFLDPPAQAGILRLLREVVTDGDLSLVLVLHDLRLAAEYADHAVLLRDGAVLAAGAPAEVLRADLLSKLYDCEPAELGLTAVPR